MKTIKIYGPPGTGKTTRLLDILEKHLGQGFPPEKIAFLTFTRAAGKEAKDRAIQKFPQLERDQFKWFRTIHSFCHGQLALNKQQVMQFGDFQRVFSMIGMQLTYRGYSLTGDDFQGQTQGDRILFMINQARLREFDLQLWWSQFRDEDVPWSKLELADRSLKQYKEQNGKLDFNDMLSEYIQRGATPEFDILFVDEAQDLSRLQWDVIIKISSGVSLRYIAGDDDQAIFEWAGADVDVFNRLEGEQQVLPISYRVPKEVQRVANDIIDMVGDRVEKQWSPRDEPGEIRHIANIEMAPLNEGQWLMLARNNHLLDQFTEYCIRMGYPFSIIGRKTWVTDENYLDSIILWEKLRQGGAIYSEDIENALRWISINKDKGIPKGVKTKFQKMDPCTPITMAHLKKAGLVEDRVWHEAFTLMANDVKYFYLFARKNGEKLLQKPRITISSIHSAKGGEADNVLICPDMAARTHEEYRCNPDPENRVWYVAVTRAKQSLYILNPKSEHHYLL